MTISWRGVMPAITTGFDSSLNVDHAFVAKHATWLIDNGCTGIVALGSLGEGATLTSAEKLAILETIVKALKGRAPVVAGISALSTAEAITLAKGAADAGCSGLMVLPPYVYLGDWRETKAHVSAILKATTLSCMLYNNPIAYTVDFVPDQVKELASEHANLNAIKESSARRPPYRRSPLHPQQGLQPDGRRGRRHCRIHQHGRGGLGSRPGQRFSKRIR